VAEAGRRAARQLASVLDDIHERRLMSGASQSELASLLGWSRSWTGVVERGNVSDFGVVELARLCSAVGLDLSVRAFAGISVLRDAGQVALINRLRSRVHPSMGWRLEALVAPGDQRAFDVLIGHPPRAAAVEAITRLRDVQAQVRTLEAKVGAASGVPVLILLIAATHANRRALLQAGDHLRSAFPLGTRSILASLARGHVPRTSGIVVL
jgi:transcriptional regulator with XRE-family HTH domain